MVWYGNYEDGWINKSTGEYIVFKETNTQIEIWLYRSTDEKRGSRMCVSENKKKAITEAKDIVSTYEKNSYWDN